MNTRKLFSNLIIFLILVLSYPHMASAEFIFKENFKGYYSNGIDGKMTDPENRALNNRAVHFWQDVGTRVVEITELPSLDTTGGIPSIDVPVNPKITDSDIPSRPGDIQHGAMMFLYGAGIDQWVEERFTIQDSALDGRDGLSEIWVQFDIFVPTNYYARKVPGHWVSKHFVLYGNAYSVNGTSLALQRVTHNGVRDGEEGWRNSMQAFVEQADGTLKNVHLENGGSGGDGPIFNLDTDLGRWSRHTLHVKFASGKSANDGILQFWIKHGDGTVSTEFDLHDRNSWADNNENFFKNGYILGWSNPGFNEPTWIGVTNLIISESIDNIDQSSIRPTVKPKKVTNLTIHK